MNSDWSDYNDAFGMFTAPGLQPLGTHTGASFLFNATSPVIQASRVNLHSLNASVGYNPGDDPPLPAFPHAFGFNTLMVDQNEVAMLDVPPPLGVLSVQSKLKPGESLNISSTVLATVVEYNATVEAHRREPVNSSWWNYYNRKAAGGQLPGDGTRFARLGNDHNIVLMTNYDSENDRDQSCVLVGIAPGPPKTPTTKISTFAPNAILYNTQR